MTKKIEAATKQEQVKQVIHKNLTIGDVVRKYPEIAPKLTSFGVHCVGCHVSEFETLEQGLAGHGMSEEMIDDAMRQLNEVVEETKKGSGAGHGTAGHTAKHGQTEALIITENAAEKVKELMKKEGQIKTALRIEVVPGGCSGMTYDFSFDDEQHEDDTVVEKNGLKVVVDEASMEYLKGCTINYVETLHEAGFKIENPNAKASCGCGSSFA